MLRSVNMQRTENKRHEQNTHLPRQKKRPVKIPEAYALHSVANGDT